MSEDQSPELDGTVSWAALLAETRQILESCGVSENPRQEAKWILEEVTGTHGAEFVDAMEGLATVRGVNKLDSMVARRRAGEPIQYVLGHWAFRNLDLLVDSRVLIPRPETEVITGLALDELDRIAADRATVVDLGTGSGAIGLSIAMERPGAQVWLTDAHEEAICVARANLVGLGIQGGNVRITHGSWFEAVPAELAGQIDVIVSNPPYVPSSDVLPDAVKDWEPQTALISGDDGLDDLRVIVAEATTWLRPGGALVLEMASGQVETVAALASEAGYQVRTHTDYAGLDRGLVAQWE